jgi:hypothetical protein
MKLAFRNKFFGYTEKEVDITLNLGTFEAVCKAMGLVFKDIEKEIKNDSFIIELLYQGYITNCKDRYHKPEWARDHAKLWQENMSKAAQKEFMEKVTVFFGDIKAMAGDKKKVKSK